jgi:hypothetical protein
MLSRKMKKKSHLEAEVAVGEVVEAAGVEVAEVVIIISKRSSLRSRIKRV